MTQVSARLSDDLVRSIDDLRALADVGCGAALVASALHDGRVTRADIEAVSVL